MRGLWRASFPAGWSLVSASSYEGMCCCCRIPWCPPSIALGAQERGQFLLDMARLGDALLHVTDALRINYAILGNVEPALHAHVMPRYAHEPEALRTAHPWAHDWQAAPLFDRAEYTVFE